MREIFVENCKTNIKLSSYIKNIFPNISTNSIFKALRNKDIKVNDKRVNSDIIITNNDKINIYITDNILFNLPTNLDIIYEDNNIIAAYKPQGILSNNSDFEPTFENIVQNYCSTAKITHRLDRNTSGIILFSKNELSYKELLNAFKNGYVSKNYIAYVANSNFEKKSELIESYIVKDSKNSICKIYKNKVKNSQKIITQYCVNSINKTMDYAILEISIHTGKTHQIRVQMADISHPIIGDSKYGINEINKKFKCYKQLLFAIKYTFNFPKLSLLNYLNSIEIKLDKSYYINKLGSESYEKNSNKQR